MAVVLKASKKQDDTYDDIVVTDEDGVLLLRPVGTFDMYKIELLPRELIVLVKMLHPYFEEYQQKELQALFAPRSDPHPNYAREYELGLIPCEDLGEV